MFLILRDDLKADVKGIEIDTDFRTMIKIECVLNETIDDNEKIIRILDLFYKGNISIQSDITFFWNEVFKFYTMQDEEMKKQSDVPQKHLKRLFDFETESALIYSAFASSYGIRLCNEHMHWWEFLTLLYSLPNGSEMHERIYYRSIDTDKIEDSAERKRIKKIAKAYELVDLNKPVTKEEAYAKFKADIQTRQIQVKMWMDAHKGTGD